MQNNSKVKIKEIFTSLQGEGPYAGQKQVFIRFSNCNLNCKYCDTDFKTNLKEYNIDELYNHLKTLNCNILSLTGGEPLLEIKFLKSFLRKHKLEFKIYLETNGTLYNRLKEIIDFVDVVACDIKLKSATAENNRFEDNDKFLDIASKKETFIKVVFDKNITEKEISDVINLAKKYNLLIVLQPKMPLDKEINLIKIFENFYKDYQNVRLIPQVHKFLNIE